MKNGCVLSVALLSKQNTLELSIYFKGVLLAAGQICISKSSELLSEYFGRRCRREETELIATHVTNEVSHRT